MKLQVKLHAEDLHHTYCRHFQTNLLFWWSILDDTKIHRTPISRKTFIRASRDRNLGIYMFFVHLITCLHTGLCTSYFAPLKYLLVHLCTLTYLIVHLVQRKKYFRIVYLNSHLISSTCFWQGIEEVDWCCSSLILLLLIFSLHQWWKEVEVPRIQANVLQWKYVNLSWYS